MTSTAHRAIAIVGLGAVMPDAPNVAAFWDNIKQGRYSITEVTPDRWDPELYYDPDPAAPDKAYSKIGGWVRQHVWDPIAWRMPIPPRVAAAMDWSQQWGIACTRDALQDYGYPGRPVDLDRTAVILGNAMGGEKHYFTVMRLYFPEYARELEASASFAALPQSVRDDIMRELHKRMGVRLPEVTEDTMPGELANCIAGRIANLFNFHGPNYVTDAACASAMAAISAAVEGLVEHDFDVAITGGIDRNMGASTFIKFCKIGALSATGSRPFAEGADGFVMGEGAALFMLKRLADAERDGDKIYALLRGMGGSSDGRGKGITAPNPIGQKFAVERAWENAGLSPATVGLIEGHGTSTRVGDVVEVESMAKVLAGFQLPPASVALGSVKSNIGHLKGAAGAAGLLKAALSLHHKVLPPSVHCERPNPDIDFAHSPLYVNTELRPWAVKGDTIRRAGLSAFGFGGTNFHAVLEEYIPGKINGNGKRSVAVGEVPSIPACEAGMKAKDVDQVSSCKSPLRGVLVIGSDSATSLAECLRPIQEAAVKGHAPAVCAPAESDLRSPQRLVIDYTDAADLADKASKALKALAGDQPAVWKALRAQGIYRGHGPAPKVAFLYTGQGSQYVNMLRPLFETEPIVRQTFEQANRVMTPLLGKPLTDYVFVNSADPGAVAKAEDDLRQTEITQPAVLATDEALTRLLAAYGIRPDMTMGHSLGEYGALVASGALPFEDALEAVSARGRGMAAVAMNDNGKMAAVFAPMAEIERILKLVNGYVVIANLNSNSQAVFGGASKAVEEAMQLFLQAGYEPVELPVSHAFHTSIVAGAGPPLRKELERLRLQSPRIPIAANVNGEFYPMGPDVVPKMLDILTQQVAAPVQFIKGLRTLYAAGARVFVEVGPKKALQGFAEDVLTERGDIISLFTNHPKIGDVAAFNQALCALYAAGLGTGRAAESKVTEVAGKPVPEGPALSLKDTHYLELGRMFADVLERAWQTYGSRRETPADGEPVVITGAALGLPGTDHIFDDANIGRILRGEQFIDTIPTRFRRAMLDKHITRLVKSDTGDPRFESITDPAEVIKLAARGNAFDLEKEFGVSADRMAALDRVTQLAIAVGLDALRDAGIPLVMRYRTTSKGSQLPDRWGLPDSLRDDTGVIFASAFPGCDSFADEMSRYYADHNRREQLATLESLRARMETNGHSVLAQELQRRMDDLRADLEKQPYVFDRRFLFRVLAMGHSQFAEFIGARGPNTQINSACASTAQAVALAEDWIRAGRCHRVIIISADDVTSDHMLEWIGAGFLATGAAATDEVVEEAAIPFDRRRHGMIIGMGAAALIIESAEAARERGIRPICEVLSTVTANSAFHGTRLDIQHIGQVMEELMVQAEQRRGISRREIAPKTVFVSHETYTPARGGSASAEIYALRKVFADTADQIVISNTKGFTGHAMGTGIEDVVAVKALETGCVPPVANFKEVDPELGKLNLSKGGIYPVEYALHLGAGFGSQISMILLHWTATKDGVRPRPESLGYAYRITDQNAWNSWLSKIARRPVTELEVVQRTLRVPDQKLAPRVTEMPQAERPTVTPIPVVPAIPAGSDGRPAPLPKPETGDKLQKEVPVATPIAAPAAPATQTEAVKERILALVMEKTGYPREMLEMDFDLEADLGIDTVKQAEMFAAIREIYNIPRDESRKLRDYPTLAHVVRFVYEKRPDLAATPSSTAAASSAPPPAVASPEKLGEAIREVSSTVEERPFRAASPVTSQGASAPEEVKEKVLDLVAQKTGYPKEMLDLDLDLEADLGIDTVKQAEMFASIREIYNIPRDESRKLRDYPTLAHVIRFVYEKRPDLATEPPAQPAAPTPAAVSSQSPGERRKEVVAPAFAAPVAVPTAVAGPVAASPLVPSTPLAPTVEERPFRAASPVSNQGALAPEEVKEKVLDIVAQKTGYPKEMLDLDLDLEADLGIDTVKQAEMFASVRATFNIPRDENLRLRDFPTLAHVIKFATERSQAAQPKPAPRPAPASFDAANTIPRRVPAPRLRPPLDLCKPTGVTLSKGRRVVIMPDQSGVGDALAQRLESLGVELLRIDATQDANALIEQLNTWRKSGPIHGVYWLPALDREGSIHAMDPAAWREALRLRVKLLYAAMRTLYSQIAGLGTFLVSATRLGGQHGYDPAGALNPLGGAVVGFTKTYKREQMDALVKAVDFESDCTPSQIVEHLVEETLRDPGAVEIGYKQNVRWAVGLQEQPAADGQPGMTLGKDTVFLITGAAGSIVSAITADLAAASGGVFYLLDVVPEPDPNNPDLKRFTTDRDGLKRDLFTRIQARGERATPALIEKELAALERAQAALSAIQAVRAAGGTAYYFSVDLTDASKVQQVIDQVRERSGRIDVLLHAAGMERSHFLPEKELREFDLVFDVKSDGWFNLLHAIRDMPLAATVAFSSIAGRFGNAGQTDYSSANDLLCKITSSFRTTRPSTRAIVIDWTAWAGIGMATRGSIPKMMELAGIDMLPPEAGIPLIRRELTSGGTRGEVVIGQRLGALLNEWDDSGGVDFSSWEKQSAARGPMLGKLATIGVHEDLVIETTLDPKIQPFLYDHQIEGTPVLPGVMGIETFAEAAQCLLPGWSVAAVEDVTFLAPFKFYRSEPRELIIRAAFSQQGSEIIADCRLIGRRTLPHQTEPQTTTHFTGRVRLSKQALSSERAASPGAALGSTVLAADIYRIYFHGPAYQVIERAWWDGHRVIGQFASHLPENHHPAETPLLMAPRLIELCFQTSGLWELGMQGRIGLPQRVERVSLLRAPQLAAGSLYALVTPCPDHTSFDAEVVDTEGNRYLQLTGYGTVALPGTVDAGGLKKMQAIMSAETVVAA